MEYLLHGVTEITHVNEPNYFVDEQRFEFIHGYNHFISEVQGGVEMTDIIWYKLPFGILGDSRTFYGQTPIRTHI
ncbi:hypothetical protein MASR1M45_24850 [Candidatus Kapaibacterium sp.]